MIRSNSGRKRARSNPDGLKPSDWYESPASHQVRGHYLIMQPGGGGGATALEKVNGDSSKPSTIMPSMFSAKSRKLMAILMCTFLVLGAFSYVKLFIRYLFQGCR